MDEQMAGDLEYAETTLKIHRARIMKDWREVIGRCVRMVETGGRVKLDGAQT
jgi:FixJ family two-component response regulator